MRLASRRAVIGLSLLAASCAAQTGIAHAAGSWVADEQTPTIVQRGWRYETSLLQPSVATTAAGQLVTSVSWHYGFATAIDPRLRAALCGGGRCIDAAAGRGSSRVFAGLPASTTFRFYFELPGQGMVMNRLRSGPLQLVVNFE